MKHLLWLLALATGFATAQNYTITTPHMTMHVGDLVPPCVILVLNQTTGLSVGEGTAIFNGSGYATCSMGATSSSPVGTYTITVSGGDLVPKSGGSVTVVNGTIDVIAADANGAKLNDTKPYPTSFTSGPAFPMLNVTSNPICNMVHDNGGTDNTPCLQNLLTYGGLRAKAGAIVNTSGTTVSGNSVAGSNMNFTTIPAGSSVKINGTAYTVASVTSPTVLTLTATAGTQTAVLMSVPTTVNTSGTTVTSTNGISFTGLTGNILVNGVLYMISSVTDATHLTTTATLPTLTGVAFYQANWGSNGYGRGPIYLYFPGGIYAVKGQLRVWDNYWTMVGDGPQKSIIKLQPNEPQFNTGTLQPLFYVASVSGNDNFSETFQSMGIEIGQGNPNAAALEWPNNNMGAIRNVQIWSEDANASAGVYMNVSYAGPTLFKDLAVYGFQTGISATSPNNEYSLTADELTVEGQQTQGILANMTTSFQHVLSDNSMPALNSTSTGRNTMIDSELLSQNAAGTGITIAQHNQLYYKNVSCTGYGTCETDDGTGTVVTHLTLPAEGWTGTAQTIFDGGSTAGALAISDTETPIATDPAVSTWTILGSDPTTWCASITGSSSTTVFLPPGTYTTSTASLSCTVPDTVNHIVMWDSHFAATSPSSTALLALNVSGTSTTPLVIDGCMHQACEINHTGTRTLVLENAIVGYETATGAGNIYFENVGTGGYNPMSNTQSGPTFYSGQLVTGRQLDIETGSSDGTSYPKIQCQGANIFILGYKTENNSPSIIETAGCQANLFGFYYYNLQTAPVGSAPMVLTDSSLFATGFDNWNAAGRGSPYWVSETRSGVTEYLTMPGSGLSYGEALNMFYSYGAHP